MHVTINGFTRALGLASACGLGLLLAALPDRARTATQLLRTASALLDADDAALSQCLGVSTVEIRRWLDSGVPRARHADVVRLAEQAAALRRFLSEDVARGLLVLRRRRIEVIADGIRTMDTRTPEPLTNDAAPARPVSRRARFGIVITSR